MNLLVHFPVLQILIPFVGAILATLSFSSNWSYFLALFAILINSILSIYSYQFVIGDTLYQIGNWPAQAGIEYKIDLLNQPIIIFFNLVLLFYLLFGRYLTKALVLNQISEKYINLFYSLLLFAHTGYLGVVSTNDLFNLYVFIEISSLATYVLISIAQNRSSLIGAFDYLMLGTIGATLILIGIGFLFAKTGYLNITEITRINAQQSADNLFSSINYYALAFIIIGILLKFGFFPMHFWMRRAYNAASPIILTYIATIGTIFSIYLITRFSWVIFEINPSDNIIFLNMLRPLAIISIIVGGLLALSSTNVKEVIVYSATTQIGYILLMFTVGAYEVVIYIALADALSKATWFTIVGHMQTKITNLSFGQAVKLNSSGLFKFLVGMSLIFSTGLPISIVFFIKIKMFNILLTSGLYKEFIVAIIGSVLSILYNFKLAKFFFLLDHDGHTIKINHGLSGLIVLVTLQIISIFYIGNILGGS
ncbi:MAG: cation:proton antiporter [Rickettsiaceae bacterium]|nr:cation:proton antiporter [Rickettsiaceae bacterium]